MSESYDYFKCEVCDKKKKAGNEKVREIAYSQKHAGAQNGEAKLIVYSVLVCYTCDEG